MAKDHAVHRSDRPAIDFIVKTERPPAEIDTAEGHVRIGPYEHGDAEAILELFNTVFDAERTLEQWNWQYRDHPVGHHIYVGRLEDGRIASHFAGLPAKTKFNDQTVLFAEVVDTMVHPNCRGGLKKRGLYALTLLNHSYHYGHIDLEAVQMGLPNPWSYRIGSQTLYYVPMTKTYAHTKTILPQEGLGDPPETVKGLGNPFRVAVVNDFPADYEGLWEKLLDHHPVICYRDRVYMTWRYLDNPNFDYRLIEARSPAGELVGLAVLRFDWLDEPDLMIADWLIDPEAVGASEALIRTCEHVGRQHGQTAVKCVLNHMADESRPFEDKGYDLTKTDFRLVTHSYAPDVIQEGYLNRYWYYTLGDFDVV